MAASRPRQLHARRLASAVHPLWPLSDCPKVEPMRRRVLIPVLLALAVGLLVGWSIRGFVVVDDCLDAGGMWKDQGSYCYGARAEG